MRRDQTYQNDGIVSWWLREDRVSTLNAIKHCVCGHVYLGKEFENDLDILIGEVNRSMGNSQSG